MWDGVVLYNKGMLTQPGPTEQGLQRWVEESQRGSRHRWGWSCGWSCGSGDSHEGFTHAEAHTAASSPWQPEGVGKHTS